MTKQWTPGSPPHREQPVFECPVAPAARAESLCHLPASSLGSSCRAAEPGPGRPPLTCQVLTLAQLPASLPPLLRHDGAREPHGRVGWPTKAREHEVPSTLPLARVIVLPVALGRLWMLQPSSAVCCLRHAVTFPHLSGCAALHGLLPVLPQGLCPQVLH